ncbi:MAG: phosphoribosyltransferase family protein [Roseovarius sp.]
MYRDRTEAGEILARALAGMRLQRPVVLALPRGGVPVAAPVARALGAPLDLILVRKIGVPGQPELAAGAIVDGPPEHLWLNHALMRSLGLTRADLEPVIAARRAELAERRRDWLAGRAPRDLRGRDAIVIDDGIATGATIRAALAALRLRGPARVILAVPVAAADTLEELRPLADEIVCPEAPRAFRAVGLHYRNFDQVPGSAVRAALQDSGED